MTAQAVAIAYLIGSLTHVRRGISYRLLNLLFVTAIGLVSYGSYLWQQLFIRGDHWFQRFPQNLIFLATAATASFFLVEMPIRGLGRPVTGVSDRYKTACICGFRSVYYGSMATIQSIPTPSIRRMTAAEFEALPDSSGFELDDGMLVELNVGNESSWIGGEVYRQLANFVIEHKLGWAYPQDTAFKCFADDRDRIRKPDAAFVGRGRLPAGYPPLGTCTMVPDLVVEVVSPGDMATDLERKVVRYIAAGVRLVWVIYPATRTAHVTRPSGPSSDLRVTDSLQGEVVMPGFSIKLESLFPHSESPTA